MSVVSRLHGVVSNGGGRRETQSLMVSPGVVTGQEYLAMIEVQVGNQTSMKQTRCSGLKTALCYAVVEISWYTKRVWNWRVFIIIVDIVGNMHYTTSSRMHGFYRASGFLIVAINLVGKLILKSICFHLRPRVSFISSPSSVIIFITILKLVICSISEVWHTSL